MAHARNNQKPSIRTLMTVRTADDKILTGSMTPIVYHDDHPELVYSSMDIANEMAVAAEWPVSKINGDEGMFVETTISDWLKLVGVF